MQIMVAVKRVVDPGIKVRVRSDNTGIELANLKMSMNPFDEIAVEEAVRLKEKGAANEVCVVSIGPEACKDVLRTGMAVGADRAIHVLCTSELEPLAVAKTLAALCRRDKPSLVMLGKQAIDGEQNQVGQMLAGFLGAPQATFASKVEIVDQEVQVTRETDDGTEVLSMRMPAVITADLRLNEPRYVTLPSIMKAKKKPIESLPVESLDVDIAPRMQTLKVLEPQQRTAGEIVKDIATLVERLRTGAKVIQ